MSSAFANNLNSSELDEALAVLETRTDIVRYKASPLLREQA
jgi:hypothetical protein